MAKEVLADARRSGDPGLIAASEHLVADVNTNNTYVCQQLFVDLGNACRSAGVTV
jgi:hypothetical protein